MWVGRDLRSYDNTYVRYSFYVIMIKSGQLDNCSISDDLNCKMLLKYVLISQRGCSFSSNTNDMRSDSNDHEKTLLEKPSRKYVNTVLNKRV